MVVAKSGYIHDRLRYALHTERFCRSTGRCARLSGSEIRHHRRPHRPGPEFRGGPVRPAWGARPSPTMRCWGGRTACPSCGCGRRQGGPISPGAHGLHRLPLAGDWLYRGRGPGPDPRPALHAHALDLDHPVTGEHLSLTAPIPADMVGLAPELLTETECASEEI